jgi:predicted RNase H-like HicB family nuclease
MQTVTLVFEPAEEGGFSAYVAEVPGVNSQGETIEEAKRMVIEALNELMEYRREKAHRKATEGTVYDRIVLA